jgi:hypothetical protein
MRYQIEFMDIMIFITNFQEKCKLMGSFVEVQKYAGKGSLMTSGKTTS